MRILLIVVFVAIPGLTAGQTRDTRTEQAIVQLERDLNAARLENDVRAVNQLYAPELFTVTARGVGIDVGNQGQGPVNDNPNGEVLERVELSEPRVRVYGDTAVSTYTRSIDLRATTGARRRIEIVSSHVWVRREGRWQLVLSQTTEVPRPTSPPAGE